MTSKETERKALEKIAAILGTLDSDGYVNTAFAGVLDVARENIENDWACSMQERVELAERRQADAENSRDVARDMAAAAQQQLERAWDTIDVKTAEADSWSRSAADQAVELERLQQEVMRLKARLYDMEHAGE